MGAREGRLIRAVTEKECPWLSKNLPQGKKVYEYSGYTYGCISSRGVAVSDKPDTTPFYEVPKDAAGWIS